MADTAMGCRNFDSVRAGVKRFPARASLQQLPHACMHAHTHRQSHARIKRVKSGISAAVFGLKQSNYIIYNPLSIVHVRHASAKAKEASSSCPYEDDEAYAPSPEPFVD